MCVLHTFTYQRCRTPLQYSKPMQLYQNRMNWKLCIYCCIFIITVSCGCTINSAEFVYWRSVANPGKICHWCELICTEFWTHMSYDAYVSTNNTTRISFTLSSSTLFNLQTGGKNSFHVRQNMNTGITRKKILLNLHEMRQFCIERCDTCKACIYSTRDHMEC